jgi:PAS domain S-box-containing protein
METDRLLYLIPYIISALLSVGILLYTRSKRNFRGAREFMFFLIGQTIWLSGILIELVAADIFLKILWDKFQWVGGVISMLALPFFVIQFSNFHLKNRLRFSLLIGIVPVLFILLLFTDRFHHLLYPDPILLPGPFYSELSYRFTWVVYAFAVYSYSVTIASIVFLIIKSPKSSRVQRIQITLITIGGLIPIFGTAFGFLGIHLLPQRDPTPLFTGIGNLILAWGLFRYHVFEMLPIARETIVENMDDVVVVLDANDRIVDINKQALKTLELEPATVIGLPATSVLSERTEILEMLAKPGNYSTEIYFEEDGIFTHYDLKSTILNSPDGDYLGRIFVARDVSSYAHLQWELKTLNEHLEERVADQTREIAESYETTLEGWARALELRDKETEGHSRRVIGVTVRLARALGVNEHGIDQIRRGAILHDIGKMAIPDEILRKTGELTDAERQIVNKHPETAFTLLKDIPYLQNAMEIPYCHHERWDGTGYPRGLKGEEIPLSARIFAVVDVWDALLSDRSYSKAWNEADALQYISENSGTYFDPAVVEVFLCLINGNKETASRL